MTFRAYCFVVLAAALPGGAVKAHPHPGGIVVRGDGTVFAGDILQPRVFMIEPSGKSRELAGVGHVRDLALAPDGTVYGVSQGAGLWNLGVDGRVEAVRSEFRGLFTFASDGSLVLAPADSLDRRPRLEFESPKSMRTTLAMGQIDSLTHLGDAIAVGDGSAVRIASKDGAIETWTHHIGEGLHGLAATPRGLVVAVYNERRVVELTNDGTQRVLLTSEPPWAPTDVAFHDGAVYVLEFAQHPCCWKGPRVRRVIGGEPSSTLLTIDDGDHRHPVYESPWFILGLYIAGGATLTATAAMWAGSAIRRQVRTRRRLIATKR
jgi:hypothetical protein